jgi:hypothetical protein
MLTKPFDVQGAGVAGIFLVVLVFVLPIRRGAAGVEGFDINDQSVGLFENDDAAAAAVWRAARGSGA